MTELDELAKQIPNCLIIQKRLWSGNVYVDIEHFRNDVNEPLDYVSACKKMIQKIKEIPSQ